MANALNLLGCGVGGAGGGGGGGTPEIFTIATVADIAGSLNGTYFECSKVGQTIAAFMSAPIAEQTEVTLPDGAALVTNSTGLYFTLAQSPTNVICFWFNTGSESQPSATADQFVEVTVSSSDFVLAVEQAAISAASGFGISGTGSPPVFTAQTAGNVTAAGGDFSVSILVTGADGATPPVGYDRTIEIPYVFNDDDTAIAGKIATAINADADWNATASGSPVTVTAAANGPRPDAADVNTGFTITVTQQGS